MESKKIEDETCNITVAGKRTYKCSFELTLDIIGGKWKPIIIYFLGKENVLRFSELYRMMPEVSERMLVTQLRALEEDKIVHRKIYQVVPPKVEYSLTEKGKTLMPILQSLLKWGEEYYENTLK